MVTRVSQSPVLALTQDPSELRASQVVIQFMGKEASPVRSSALMALVLSRARGKRVMTTFDTYYKA